MFLDGELNRYIIVICHGRIYITVNKKTYKGGLLLSGGSALGGGA